MGLDETLRSTIAGDLAAFAGDVAELEHVVAAVASASEAYASGLALYEQADAGLVRLEDAEQALAVVGAIKQGRHRMAVARARAQFSSGPKHVDPCFFDTTHGPAAGLSAWTPEGLGPRTVPCCAACLAAVTAGTSPAPREVVDGDRVLPFWDGRGDLAYWFQGFFGIDAECVPALMLEGFRLADRFTTAADDGVHAIDPFAPQAEPEVTISIFGQRFRRISRRR
jgi:hypothetical protein